MQKDVNDQELTLKKRARRRLVGAVALVLLMIIVLPMILKDRTNKQPADEVTITLNNNQKPQILPEASDFDSNVIPSNEVEHSSPQVDNKSTQESQPGGSVNEPLDDPEASKPVDSDSENKKTASSQIVAKPTQTPEIDNYKNSAPGSKFYVQIGVFSDEANVKNLQAKLTDLGYKSQIEKIDTPKGKKIRLRTHLLGERSEAAIALQNIKDAGLTGMVVSQ